MDLKRFEADDVRPPFNCGDDDLNEFFAVDSIDSGRELMSVTYAFMEEGNVIGYFSIANDSIKREECPRSSFDRIKKLLPSRKRYSSMPAAKIGRLAVCDGRRGGGVGTIILDWLKVSFTTANKTGCRFLLVDAYNKPDVLRFYERNGFVYLTGNDEKEDTRIMYFDLKTFRP